MWSVEYVQVPDEEKLVVPEKTPPVEGNSVATTDSARVASPETSQPQDIPYRRKRSVSCDSYEEDNQSAVERLRDFKDPDNLTSKLVELSSSVDSNSHFMSKVLEKLEGSGKTGRESQSAIDRNISTSSSISDLYTAEETASADVELNRDGEVLSLKSAGSVSLSSAVEVTESLENTLKPSDHEKVSRLQLNLVTLGFITFC